MPVEVMCGSCHSKLRVPETALGRKVKCPKCNTVFEARAEEPEVAEVEEVEEEVKAAPSRKRRQEADEDEDRPAKKRPRDEDEDDRPRNKKKSRRDEDEDEEDAPPSKKRRRDEDEDEDEDDRPRSKKGRRDEDEYEEDEDDRPRKRPKKAKGGKGLIIGLAAGGGGLLLIGIILLLVFTMGGGGDSNCTPANWNRVKHRMTRAEAENILGPGHEMSMADAKKFYEGMPTAQQAQVDLAFNKETGGTNLWWRNGKFSAELCFGKDGKVLSGQSYRRLENGGFELRAIGGSW